MAFDGIVTKAIITELKTVLIGAKINKVFEPTKNEIILGLYNNGKNYSLLLSSNPESCRINLTTYSKPNPKVAPNFCMLLRKYLIGSKIIDISNKDLERTVEIKFEAYNELNDLVIRKLFIEIMSRQSNIILCNENNIIIDTLKHVETEHRELLPAHKFIFTPITKTSYLNLSSFEEFLNILNNNKEKSLSKKIPTLFIGLSKTFILETLKNLKISDTEYINSDLEKLYYHINNILNNIENFNVSCTPYENDYTITLNENKENLNINFFVDDFYFNKEQISTFINSRNNLLRIISGILKKEYKKLSNINSKLKECNNMEDYKLYGELLTSNLYKFKNSPNLDSATVENYYDNNNLIKIPLDKSISFHKNIDKYFKKYNKLKNTLAIVSIQKEETEKNLNYIESVIYSVEHAKNLSDIAEIYEEISNTLIVKKEKTLKTNKEKKKKISKNKEFIFEPILLDGYAVYVGKNNIQNDYLTMKFADKNDYWFHTQKIHGSHVILKTNGITEIPDEIFLKCATLAKEYSKANNSSNVPVDFCLVRHVKKPSGSKPGMVIYTNYKTIFVK